MPKRTYVLANGRHDRRQFVSGDTPELASVDSSLDQARHFRSPGEALSFRAVLDRTPDWRDANFIVHEYDGHILHSLDV